MLVLIWRSIRLVFKLGRWLFGLALMILLLRHSTPPLGTPYYQAASVVRDVHFDYVNWEAQAIAAKVTDTFSGVGPYMTEAARTEAVRTYFADLTRAQQLERAIEAAYTDPAIDDPAAATATQRAERNDLRASLRTRQTLVESILEDQVASVLVSEGFGLGGQLIPPVSMRFTRPTQVLVTSPRDAIDMDTVITVEPLPVDERAALETQIEKEQDIAALIVPIGGMALYPAMIVETTSIPFTLETFAHEWLHHYLLAFPLGYNYELMSSGEARAINETTATLFGREVSRMVIARYYPDLLPPPPPEPEETDPQADETPPPTPAPPRFDYATEMNLTRVTVDRLLDAGMVNTAEAYMESRRQLFVENGIGIRKLNQAWFAFYGGYQAAGFSASGEDPIGPAVQKLRDDAPSIRDWIHTMRSITTREALLTWVAANED